MRVRLQLLAPFEESKVLVSLPKDVRTISDLRKHVRQSLSSVLALSTSPKDLLMEIDGFELLAGSSVDIVESGDVVTVRLKAGSSKADLGVRKRESTEDSAQNKRLRTGSTSRGSTNDPTTGNSARPVVPQHSPAPSSSSSSSSSASSDSSTSASSSSVSSSSSSSSSSSASASSTSSSSAASADTSRPDVLAEHQESSLPPATSVNMSSAVHMNHVPPGNGKLSTHDRNRRRKMAKKMKKLAEQNDHGSDGPIVQATSDPNVMNGDRVTPTRSELPVPKAMANRNKKKGFLREMASLHGTKTVFGDDAQASSTPLKEQEQMVDETPITPDVTINYSGRKQAWVVPPSEKVLPSNVFVTRVEYQRKGWTPRSRNSSSRRDRNAEQSIVEESTGVDDHEEDGVLREPFTDNGPYVSQSQEMSGPGKLDEVSEDDWVVAESRFDTLPALTEVSSLIPGSVIAWKELLLDPYTFTPQLAVQLGAVEKSDDETVTLKRLQRYEEDDGSVPNEEISDAIIHLNALSKEPGKYRVVR